MNYLLHKHKFPNSVVNIPEGLSDLIGDITREVLRCQPDSRQIYSFIANYLEDLVRTREKLQVADETIAQILNNVSAVTDSMHAAGITIEKSQEAGIIIQQYFQSYLDYTRNCRIKQGKLPKEFKEAELLADLIRQCKFTENEIIRTRPSIQKAYKKLVEDYLRALKSCSIPSRSLDTLVKYTLRQYMENDPSIDIYDLAATRIQAFFKGYLVRNKFEKFRYQSTKLGGNFVEPMNNAAIILADFMRQNNSLNLSEFEYKYSYLPLDELHRASVLIQKTYRGYKVRKDLTRTLGAGIRHLNVEGITTVEVEVIETFDVNTSSNLSHKARVSYTSLNEEESTPNSPNDNLDIDNIDELSEVENEEMSKHSDIIENESDQADLQANENNENQNDENDATK